MPKLMFAVAGVCVSLLLVGCGESSDDAYMRGYDEGYEEGVWEVCAELKDVAPGVEDSLNACYGY